VVFGAQHGFVDALASRFRCRIDDLRQRFKAKPKYSLDLQKRKSVCSQSSCVTVILAPLFAVEAAALIIVIVATVVVLLKNRNKPAKAQVFNGEAS
jgi:hypothetical protein